MNIYFAAIILLGIAGMIENRCSTPALRPEYPPADRAFRLLGRISFLFWAVLLFFGFWKLEWWQPVAAFLGSLAVNALVVQNGVRPWWPGLAMGLALVGLGLTSKIFFEAF